MQFSGPRSGRTGDTAGTDFFALAVACVLPLRKDLTYLVKFVSYGMHSTILPWHFRFVPLGTQRSSESTHQLDGLLLASLE